MEQPIVITDSTSSGDSVIASAQGKAAEVAEQAQQQAREQAQKIGSQVRRQIDQRSTQAGDQTHSIAQAIRRSADELRSQGKDGPANLVDRAAGRVEDLADYLSASDSERILRDVEDFARRQPALVAAGAAVLGFMGARFLGASARNRAESSRMNASLRDTTGRYPIPHSTTARAAGPGAASFDDEIVLIEEPTPTDAI